MTAAPLLIRPVRLDDAAPLVQLAALLDTVNLPRDPEIVAEIIAESTASFARLTRPAPAPTAPQFCRGTYTLGAPQGAHLLGTASLLSHHGTAEDPHYYLRVVEHTFHSRQLDVEYRRHLLRLEH